MPTPRAVAVARQADANEVTLSLFAIHPPLSSTKTIFDVCGPLPVGDEEPPKTLNQPRLSSNDLAQGLHPDCFFVASCIALAHAQPQLLESLFLSTEIPMDQESAEKFKIRFFRPSVGGNQKTQQQGSEGWAVRHNELWETVSVAPSVLAQQGNASDVPHPMFVRSPTRKWWPYLL